MEITTPGYIKGYFWWYYKHDCVPKTKDLWDTLDTIVSKWENPASINENTTAHPTAIKLYPNPARGKIFINSNFVTKIEIFNILGERVKVISNSKKIDISDLPKGVFFLRMATNAGLQTGKFIHLSGK